MGTPLWMAPECLAGCSGNTAAGDVWGFGLILYEVLTRKAPYEGKETLCSEKLPGS
jgi:serine/threonine protein kinase